MTKTVMTKIAMTKIAMTKIVMTKIVMTKIVMTKTRRTGLMLALVAAVISGFAIFLNGYGVKAVGNATVYTTAKNVVAALVLFAVVAAGRTLVVTVSRPQGRDQW